MTETIHEFEVDGWKFRCEPPLDVEFQNRGLEKSAVWATPLGLRAWYAGSIVGYGDTEEQARAQARAGLLSALAAFHCNGAYAMSRVQRLEASDVQGG